MADVYFPSGHEENLSREVFFNRFMYMMDMLNSSISNNKHMTVPNPNAGQVITKEVTPWRTALEIASRPDANGYKGMFKRDIVNEAISNVIPDTMVTDKVNPDLHLGHLRMAHDFAQFMTAIDTGFKFSIPSLMPFMNVTNGWDVGQLAAGAVKDEGRLSEVQRGVMEGLLTNRIITAKAELEQEGHGLAAANLHDDVAALSNTPSFVLPELYPNSEDIGKLDKRYMPTEYFGEDAFTQADEALYHYNEGGIKDPRTKFVDYTEPEEEYKKIVTDNFTEDDMKTLGMTMEKLGFTRSEVVTMEDGTLGIKRVPVESLQQFLQNPKASEFRDFTVQMQDSLEHYFAMIDLDRDKMRESRRILRAANNHNVGIHEYPFMCMSFTIT
jgi:hypothetical protein